MNRHNLVLITLILYILFSGSGSAQSVEGPPLTKCRVQLTPEEYYKPRGAVLGESAARSKRESAEWIVFSDRDRNKTYRDAGLQKPLATIDFLQPFLVAQEKGNSVRLVSYDRTINQIDNNGNFKSNEGDVGWVSKNSLLLWSNSLIDSSTSYTKKAIAVKSLPEGGDYSSLLKDLREKGILKCYNNPEENKEYKNSNDINKFQYIFIYKEENKMCLIGNINHTDASQIAYDILGWTPAKSLQRWNSAICLRINFDDEAVRERNNTSPKIRPKFFYRKEDATSYLEGKDVPDSRTMPFNYTDYTKEGSEKENPFLLGFPILDTGYIKDQRVFKTGYITNTYDENGKSIFTVTAGANWDKLMEEIRAEKENVNIIFVMDGEERSRHYYRTFANAVDGIQFIDNPRYSENKYKLGAVIYNDSKCEENDQIKTIPLMSSKASFTRILTKEGNDPAPCVFRRESGGALFYEAIFKACKAFDDGKSTNIIIAAGMVSNNQQDKGKRDDALKALIGKKVKLYSYQLINKSGAIWDNYFLDCKYFLESAAKQSDKSFEAEIKTGERKKYLLDCGGDKCELKNATVQGAIFYKSPGQFTSDEINTRIKRNLLDIDSKLAESLAYYKQRKGEKASSGDDVDKDDIIKQFQSWFMEKGASLEDLKLLSDQQNYQLFISGYASTGSKKYEKQILVRTLFMTSNEFDRFKGAVYKVKSGVNPAARRSSVVNAIKEMIYSYRGAIDPNVVKEMSPNDLMKLATGMPTNNPGFNRPIKCLELEKCTPDSTINSLICAFDKIDENLKAVSRNPIYHYTQGDLEFYWITEEKLYVNECYGRK